MKLYIKSWICYFHQKFYKGLSFFLIFIFANCVSFAQLNNNQIDTLANKFLLCLQNKDFNSYEKLFASADFYTDFYYKASKSYENEYPLIYKTKINYEYKSEKINGFLHALYFEKDLKYNWNNIVYINHKISSPNHFETDNGMAISREDDYILLKDKTTNKFYVMDIIDIIAFNKVLLSFKIKDIKESKTFDEYESKYRIIPDAVEATEDIDTQK